MKTRLVFFLLFMISGAVDARGRKALSLNPDGSISGIPSYLEKVSIDAKNIANPLAPISFRAGSHYQTLPACLRKFIHTQSLGDVRVYGRLYGEEERTSPYSVTFDFFDTSPSPGEEGTLATELRVNIHDASIGPLLRGKMTEEGQSLGGDWIDSDKECGRTYGADERPPAVSRPAPPPNVDLEHAVPAVLTGKVVAEDYYDLSHFDDRCGPPEDTDPNTICFRLPPFQRIFRPTSSVYGPLPGKEIEIQTFEHAARSIPDPTYGSSMLLAFENAGRYRMRFRSKVRIWRRPDGENFFLINGSAPIPWLPCAVYDLRQPIDGSVFPIQARLAPDDGRVKEHPELFDKHDDYAVARYGISVTRLREYLRALKPAAKDFQCEEAARR